MNVKWIDAKSLLEEGDILLFRAKTHPFALNYWIALYGRSIYSHVSLVSLSDGQPECLEFKEFVGARKHPLIEEIERGAIIDVYRVYRQISYSEFDKETGKYKTTLKEFTPEIAKNITDHAKRLIANKLGYSYYLIWTMLKLFIPIARLFMFRDIIEWIEEKHFVCSTLISHTYRKNFIDLIPGIPDHLTQPGDIGRSAIIQYLFTIQR